MVYEGPSTSWHGMTQNVNNDEGVVTLFMGEVDLIRRGKLAHNVLDLSGPLFLQKLVPKIEGH